MTPVLPEFAVMEPAEQVCVVIQALSPVIGYDKASAIAHKANDDGTTLRQAALATGYISADDFDRIVNPSKMVGDPAAATAAT